MINPIYLMTTIIVTMLSMASFILMSRLYDRYRHHSHLLLTIAFVLLSIGNSFLIFSNSENSAMESAKLYIILANLFIHSSLPFVVLGMMYFRYNEYNLKTMLATYYFGISTGTVVMLLQNIELNFDTINRIWLVTTPPLISLSYIPIYIMIFAETLIPLWKKAGLMYNKQEQRSMYLTMTGMGLLMIAGIITSWNYIFAITVLRIFLLSFGFFIWTISIYISPFMIAAIKGTPLRILVAQDSGILFFHHKFEAGIESQIIEAPELLMTSLISAIKHASTEIFDAKGEVISYNFENKTALIYSREGYMFTLIASDFSPVLKGLVLRYAELCLPRLLSLPLLSAEIDLSLETELIFARPLSEAIQ